MICPNYTMHSRLMTRCGLRILSWNRRLSTALLNRPLLLRKTSEVTKGGQPVRGLGWFFCPPLPKHHPQYKRQTRNYLITVMCFHIAFVTASYLGSLPPWELETCLAAWNPERLAEVRKERMLEEERLAEEEKEKEMEKAKIRLREGHFYVPDRTKAWSADFLKNLEVKPAAEKPWEK